MIFYSRATGGLYDTRLHGERVLLVPDPNWQRPFTILRLQPGEALPDGSQLNVTSEVVSIEMLDASAEHPLIEVLNPACLLPSDAVEISSELRTELLAGNALGQVIVPDGNGQPILQDLPPPTIEELASQAAARRSQLLQQAAQAIAPLQDAVDLGESTAEEDAALETWKRYRVALGRLEQQPGYPQVINWPDIPTA